MTLNSVRKGKLSIWEDLEQPTLMDGVILPLGTESSNVYRLNTSLQYVHVGPAKIKLECNALPSRGRTQDELRVDCRGLPWQALWL